MKAVIGRFVPLFRYFVIMVSDKYFQLEIEFYSIAQSPAKMQAQLFEEPSISLGIRSDFILEVVRLKFCWAVLLYFIGETFSFAGSTRLFSMELRSSSSL
jgi:hypothetical protein